VKLSHSFYEQKTALVAKNLLGQKLVRVYRGKRIAGIITETEAYLGVDDPACHSFGGRHTPRVKSLYLPGGHAYVYFVYGMHFCFNVVTGTSHHPEAVLIRSLEPAEGIEWMEKFRGQTNRKNLTTGPAKLCEALKIDRKCDGKNLLKNEIFIERGLTVSTKKIAATSRVGVAYAGKAAHWPLRFYIQDSEYVSKR